MKVSIKSRQGHRFCPKSILYIAAMMIAALLGAPFAGAQSTGGRIRGTVTDSSGAAVVGANVSLTNIATNLRRDGQTNDNGGGIVDPGWSQNRPVVNEDIAATIYSALGIDYTKKNFVHADLSPDEFVQSMKKKGESFWTIFFRLLTAGMSQQQAKNPGKNGDLDVLMALFDKDRAIKLKRIMADQFADMDMITAAFNGPSGSTLITERNKAALAVLGKQIAAGRKKIAIFYGGGHMPDMESRAIADYQLKRAGQEWLEAWSLRDKK
jgi:hypothetical protein